MEKSFWGAFMNQELAIYAPNQHEYNKLMKFFHQKELCWIDGSDAVDHRKISSEGIYIIGTQEAGKTNVLVMADKGDSFLDEMAVISSYSWLNLFNDEDNS